MPGLLGNVLLCSGLGFGAAIQPGPLQAFLTSRVVASGWRQTLPACLAPLLSDGPIAVLAVLVVGRIPPGAQHVLRASGGLLLLCLAASTAGQWRRRTAPASQPSAPRTLLEAVLVNLLNPNPYLGWALVMGPAVVAAWSHHPACALGFVVAFYATMLVTLAAFVVLLGTARFLNASSQRALVGASALLLAGLGLILLVAGVRGFQGAAGGSAAR
jgi:threonine/homoserine/homoserine lactone efflux protein